MTTTPKKHIMLDLETMGTSPNAPIWAIGAVRFDENGVTEDTFYHTISLKSAVEHGAEMDPETVVWWLSESEETRKELINATGDMAEALDAFAAWVGAEEPEGVWGNGAGFDNTLLTQTYRRQGQQTPWSHRADRCYRTEKAKSPIKMPERIGTHHNALDDAISQAHHLVAIWTEQASSDADFKRGYLIACTNMMNLHGDSVAARDTLDQVGITEAEVTAMDLSEYDKSALTVIRAEPHGDPIEKTQKTTST